MVLRVASFYLVFGPRSSGPSIILSLTLCCLKKIWHTYWCSKQFLIKGKQSRRKLLTSSKTVTTPKRFPNGKYFMGVYHVDVPQIFITRSLSVCRMRRYCSACTVKNEEDRQQQGSLIIARFARWNYVCYLWFTIPFGLQVCQLQLLNKIAWGEGFLVQWKNQLQIFDVILPYEKFQQFDWLRAVVFQLNLKYLLVKMTNLLLVVVWTNNSMICTWYFA